MNELELLFGQILATGCALYFPIFIASAFTGTLKKTGDELRVIDKALLAVFVLDGLAILVSILGFIWS
jgi:hypothetical protein